MTCAACEAGRLNAKAAGHSDWREGVCWDHAAFDLDSSEGRALMANLPSEPQPDLFGETA